MSIQAINIEVVVYMLYVLILHHLWHVCITYYVELGGAILFTIHLNFTNKGKP